MAILAAFMAGAATLSVVLFFILRKQETIKTCRSNEIKTDADRKRIERNIAEHGEEVRRIMEKINRYKNAVVILFFPIAAMGQQMAIPKLDYKDVISINKPGIVMNYADSLIAINPERYRFYEGLLIDITNLNQHYEAIVASKDSIIDLTQKQLRESDDLLNQCATDLNAMREPKESGWLGGTGRVMLGLIIGLASVAVGIKLL